MLLNARNKSHELRYATHHAGLRVLLASDEYTGTRRRGRGCPRTAGTVVLGADPGFAEDSVPDDEVLALQAQIAPADPALLLYTSGTTANPKGCVISHGALRAACSQQRGAAAAHPGGPLLDPAGDVPRRRLAGPAGLLPSRGLWCFSHVGFFEAGVALDQLAREAGDGRVSAFELIWMAILDHPRYPRRGPQRAASGG